MKTNQKAKAPRPVTHEGGRAASITAEQKLRRSVMSCFLWEREFYEDGEEIADRIQTLTHLVPPSVAASIAIEARTKGNLRHVPLLILSALAQDASGTSLLSETIPQVLLRADEPGELISVYWRKGKRPLSAQMKKGIAKALQRFDAYQLGKYDRDSANVKLRDVIRLVHPVPKDDVQAANWKALIAGELATPDTWEVALSGGADKRATFERLIREGKLGYLALLRNLRNMVQARCDQSLVSDAIEARQNGADKVLPFRFIAAARHAPEFVRPLNRALLQSVATLPRFRGRTLILVDTSASMDAPLSGKSDLERRDAAAALAAIFPGDARVFSFTTAAKEVKAFEGLPGIDAILRSQSGGTDVQASIRQVMNEPHDRMIVITDEQSASGDRMPAPKGYGYFINVASAKNGIGYGPWVHIDGFSESVLRFIAEHEADHVKAA